MTNAFQQLGARLDEAAKPAIAAPRVSSFREFLERFGRVLTKAGGAPYSLKGRAPLAAAVELIDLMFGSSTGKPLTDSSLAICGGAQFGKTILAFHILAYAMAVRFMRVGYYLPDDDLVQGLVDTKLRPELIDLMPWLGAMMTIGQTVNESGRAVNRKGAFMATDGKNTGLGYMRGMGKIPTSFSMDVIIEDEKDDIPEGRAKFLAGRLSSSDLRLRFSIGTQRVFGSGQHKEFESGTQHVGAIACPQCGRAHNPEEEWPGIVRVAMDGAPRTDDPVLTNEGDFKRPGANQSAAAFDHDARYYFGCVVCGHELDREAISFTPRRPERAAQRRFSIRISQLCTPAVDLKQIVADWCNNAVRDPESMRAFRCDRLAIPKSVAQKLEPAVIERARTVAPFDLSLNRRQGAAVFAGLDTGDRCWFFARDVLSPADIRATWAEQLSAERVRARVPQLVATLGVTALFVDAGPLRDLARDLCFDLQPELRAFHAGGGVNPSSVIHFGGSLSWNGETKRWHGLRCAAVEFALQEGQGVVHKLGITQDGLLYPVIQANRGETIQRAVDELLTPAEDVSQMIDGKLRTDPAMRLPRVVPGCPPIVPLLEAHFMTGARRELDDKGRLNFVDGVENHLLLANAYSALAHLVGGTRTVLPQLAPVAFGRAGEARRAFSGIGVFA